MDRDDTVRVEERSWKGITPRHWAKQKVFEKGVLYALPAAQEDLFWKIEDSIMGSLTSKAREAALAYTIKVEFSTELEPKC